MEVKSLLMVMATLTIAGCSQNEMTEMNPDTNRTIGLDVYTEVQTRGTETTTSTLKANAGFGIFAYQTSSAGWNSEKGNTTPNFMYNEHATWTSGSWGYASLRFWPTNDDKITFFAYAPYESDWQNGSKSGVITSAATAPGIPYIKFKLKTTDKLDKMVDLVVADQRDKTYTAENGGKISFTFEHTLSRISFRAQLGAGDFDGMDGTNSFVYITHMWIVGKSHATAGSNLSLIDPASPVNANSKFYTSAKWSELHWNYEADATIAQADFSLDKMLNLESPGIDISTPAAGHDARTQGIRITKASQGAAEKAVPLFKDKEYLYLIPVGEKSGTDLTQNKGCAKGDIKIGFHYDIVSKDATNAGKFIASHGEAFIELPAGHMKRKESYLYTLKINLHKIEISDATVTPWEDIKTEATVE